MTTLPLCLIDGHLFLEIDDGRWLLDTGAPRSVGDGVAVEVAGTRFPLVGDYMGLTVAELSELAGVRCDDLLGADVLGRFDHLFDVPGGTLSLSADPLRHEGAVVPTESFMEIPIVTARVGGAPRRMFFDTGAQLSYLPAEVVRSFPPAGRAADFYPGLGRFETETHRVDLSIAGAAFTVRCGTLPELLAGLLLRAGTDGILGNEILRERRVGYFPRRGEVVL